MRLISPTHLRTVATTRRIPYQSLHMPNINRNNNHIFFQTYGHSGPWVTLVNGHTRSHKDFRGLTKHLNKIGFRCVSLDNRGSGSTTTTGSFTFQDMVEDVEAIWKELGIYSTHLLGISMGGMISRELAVRNPNIVKTLHLVSTARSPEDISPVAESPWEPSLEKIKIKLSHYFTPDFVIRNELLIVSMAKQILKAAEDGDFINKSEDQRKALKTANKPTDLSQLGVPCNIIHGADDMIIPLQSARDLQSHIPHATLHVIEKTGHLLLAEKPSELYRLVSEIIQTSEGR